MEDSSIDNNFKVPFWFHCNNCVELTKRINDIEKQFKIYLNTQNKFICCGQNKTVCFIDLKPFDCLILNNVETFYECNQCISNPSFHCKLCGNFSNFIKTKCSQLCKNSSCWEYQCSNCTRIFWKYSKCPEIKCLIK